MSEVSPAFSAPSGVWKDGEFFFPLRIYYEDTDLGGMVYHARYVSFFERVRSESIRGTAADVDRLLALDEEGGPLVYVVRRITVDYLGQAKAGDVLVGTSRVSNVRAASMEAEQRLERDGQLIAKATVLVALVDASGRPRRWPSDVRKLWQDMLDQYTAAHAGEGA